MNIIKKFFFNILIKFDRSNFIRLPDKKYIDVMGQLTLGKRFNIDNPKTFNEKIQWLKLYDRKSEYTKMVDKYEVKKYVADLIGEKYIIPTLGVYEKFDDIDFTKFPNSFVIKCTHDSGGSIVCKDKLKLDLKEAKIKIEKLLKANFYYSGREWPYKNIKPRIIVEQYIQDNNNQDLKDYKIFCFNGRAKIILVCSNRNGDYKNTNFYNTNWNLLPITRKNHTQNLNAIEKPKNLAEMIKIAEILSKNIPFIRVDLYEVNNNVFFGELTFYPSSGFEGFEPDEWDQKLGDMLELPNRKVEGKNEK